MSTNNLPAHLRQTRDYLLALGGMLHLSPRCRSHASANACLIDYCLPDGRLAARIEVEGNEREQRATVHGRPFAAYRIRLLPSAAPATRSPEDIAMEQIHLPPRYLQEIRVDLSDLRWRERLDIQIQNVITGLSVSGERIYESVDDIIVDYRSTFDTSFAVVRESLRARVDCNRLLYSQGRLGLTDLAIWTAALAKTYQQWGYYQQAREYVNELFTAVGARDLRAGIDHRTFDDLLLARHRVEVPDFGRDGCDTYLSFAMDQLQQPESKAKFLWRQSLDAIARNQPTKVPEILDHYAETMRGEPISAANIYLIRTFETLQEGRYEEALYNVSRYRDGLEGVWKKHRDIPYPAVHGVFAGLHLEAHIHFLHGKMDKRGALWKVLHALERYRTHAGIEELADGMREADTMLQAIHGESWVPTRCRREALVLPQFPKMRTLEELCSELNLIIPREIDSPE